MKIELIFQHGWGFDETCWTQWLQQLHEIPDFAASVQLGDRGYFGNRQELRGFLEDSSLKIVVAHSLGLHFLPEHILTSTDLLMVIAGFQSFHSGDPLAVRRSRRSVARMKQKLHASPATVLSDFWRNCYEPAADGSVLLTDTDMATLDSERLLEDLDLLDQSKLDLCRLSGIPSILLLTGSHDAVVPARASHALQQALPGSQLSVVSGAGHALPITHANLCILALRKALGARKQRAPGSLTTLMPAITILSEGNLETCIASN